MTSVTLQNSSITKFSDTTENTTEDVKAPSKPRVHNEHFIYVESGTSTNEELIKSLTEAISLLPQEYNYIKTKFKVNIITKADGSTYGYGYIWFEDPQLVNILLGLNVDGSERYEKVEEEGWKPDPSIEKDYLEWLNLPLPYGSSWVEVVEIEDKYKELLTPPFTKIPLPPIIKLSCYRNDPNNIYILKRATISEKEHNISTNKLFCSKVPKDVTEKDLYEIFSQYSTSKSKTKDSKTLKYPKVNIETNTFKNNQGKKVTNTSAIITFDPLTYDGMFSLLMTKRLNINNNVLYFDYYRLTKNKSLNQ